MIENVTEFSLSNLYSMAVKVVQTVLRPSAISQRVLFIAPSSIYNTIIHGGLQMTNSKSYVYFQY